MKSPNPPPAAFMREACASSCGCTSETLTPARTQTVQPIGGFCKPTRRHVWVGAQDFAMPVAAVVALSSQLWTLDSAPAARLHP